MSLSTSREWDSLSAQSRKSTIALVRMYYGDESEYIALAEKEIDFGSISNNTSLITESGTTLDTESGERLLVDIPQSLIFDGDNYLGIIKSMPSIRTSINLEEHVSSVGTFELVLSNVEYQPGSRFSDFITTLGSAGDYGFYNRKIEVKLYAEGITSWDNCLTLFTGYVRDSKQEWPLVTFSCDDGSLLQNVTIPNNAITTSDAPGDTGLADNAEGKQKQVVYGDHRFALGNEQLLTWVAEQNNQMVKCTYLGLSTPAGSPLSSKKYYQVSGHLMNEIGSIWVHDPQTDRFAKAESFSIVQNNASGAIISIGQDIVWYDYWFGDGTNTLTYGTNTWEYLANANNRERNVFAPATQPTGIVHADVQFHDLNFPLYDESIADSQISDIRILAFADSDDTPFFQINTNNVTPNSGTPAVDYGTGGSTNAEVSAAVEVAYQGGTTKSARLWNIYKQVEYVPNNIAELQIYASCRGMEYGNWIKTRTGHIDDGDSGGLIQNAAGIVESVLRDQMGLVDADIDESAFNTISNNLSDFNLAFIIYENQETEKVLKMVLKDCRSYIWQNSFRKWTIDYIADQYSSSDWDISFDEIKGSKFSQTTLDEIKPYINIRYFLASQQNENQFEYLSSVATALGFYNISEAQGTKVIETSTIKDLTAATNLGNFESKNRQAIHNMVSGSLDKLYLPLDIGDIISISDMPYKVGGEDIGSNATRNGQTIYKYWFVFDIDRDERVSFKAIQLHKLS